MAGAGLLMLLDDIASLLDDVALMSKTAAGKTTALADDVAGMSKVAMGKTAGVLGDDLALNAQQVAGVRANRELPVVWAVAKGSFKNKLILVPAALLISAFVPWLITPLLMVGGAFLCFEGVEKILEVLHKAPASAPAHDTQAAVHDAQEAQAKGVAPSSVRSAHARGQDPQAYEKAKVAGAVRTDFILSAEIIAIALGTVADQPLLQQCAVLAVVALAITVFVYGLVALIVRMDDAGAWLQARPGAASQALGRGLIACTPWLMRGLSVLGTAAMFLVGGSLLVHGVPALHHAVEAWAQAAGALGWLVGPVVHVLVGAVVGALVVVAVHLWQRLRPAQPA